MAPPEERAPHLRWLGPALTILAIAATETATEVFHGGQAIRGAFLLLGIVPIAYAGLKDGLKVALLSTTLLAVYTMHFTSPHERIIVNTAESWMGFTVIALVGFALAYPMSRIKASQDRMRASLEARALALEQSNRELTAANESLEAFGYVVSHDLKEPVRAIENYLTAAQDEWPEAGSKKFVEEAYQANARLARLLQGLLSYSRTSSQVPNPRVVDIEGVLLSETCATQYATALESRGGHLEVRHPLPRVLGDEVILAQMLGNLVLNAIRHNPTPVPQITVSAEAGPRERARLVIADNGRGFPEDVLTNFEKVRGKRPTTINSGFGLVIAHRAAQQLGGTIRLVNAPSGGAEVHLDLPAAPVDRSRDVSENAERRSPGTPN